jgi:phospholipid/cholesterol/gamma-HCH transport system ATP-binding protein
MANTALLSIEDIHAGYPGKPEVLDGVSFSIQKGEVVGLASLDDGGGKTTLVKSLAGLLPPTSGQVIFDGDDIYKMGYRADQRFRARVSVVFEGGALMVNQTIWDNIALPLRYHGDRRGRDLRVSVERLLAQCGYNEGLQAFPWQVSERSRRLAAFARALARNPEFVIVDRFFQGLEMPDWRRLFELVMELNQNDGVSWLLVSELDPGIFQVAERVAILEHGKLLGLDFRKKLYANRRIRAAFEAAEMRVSQRLRRLGDSERILIVESSTEFDALTSGESEDLTTSAGADDVAETLNINHARLTEEMKQLAEEARRLQEDPYTERPTDESSKSVKPAPDDAEQTITIAPPPSAEAPSAEEDS